MPIWLREKLFQKKVILNELRKFEPEVDLSDRLLFSEHHDSHAASAFYPSPFEEAVVLTMDGVGEWTTTSAGVGRGNTIRLTREQRFPHSLGLLYSSFTYYTGFRVNSGEYKVMGLAPYGEPKYRDLILEKLIDLKADGTFFMDQSYFDYCTGLRMTNGKFDELMGAPARQPNERLEQRHMDLAASIQAVTEEIMLRLTRSLFEEFQIPNLCLAGGVALNCVGNGKILRDGKFKNIWIQPAAGDAGGSIGAALMVHHSMLGLPRRVNGKLDGMRGAYLGPGFEQSEIEARLDAAGAKFVVLGDEELLQATVRALETGSAVGWMQGRMEFGPRALGGRSIIGDARSPAMQKLLNLKVKYRESFRPFAPAVLREDVSEWFDLGCDSPYMLLVADVAHQHRREMSDAEKALFGIDKLNIPRSSIPAVTHVDYSARIQTVHEDTNPAFHKLLTAFKERTGCPVLVNTSFNVRGEPIVCSPEDAFRCFMGTEIEVLVVGNAFLRKDQQTAERLNYESAFELD
jgi:carbamoyltransferase